VKTAGSSICQNLLKSDSIGDLQMVEGADKLSDIMATGDSNNI